MNPFTSSNVRKVLLLLAAVSLTTALGCGSSAGTTPVESDLASTVDPNDQDDDHDDDGDDHDDDGDDHDGDDHDDDHDGDDHDDDGDDHDDDHDDGGDDHDDGGDDHDDDHDDDDHGDDHDDDDHGDDHDDDESSSGLGSHVHGAADLFVAWSGGDVVVDLISPSNNIFGFEYEPETDEDLALVSERTATLSEPGAITFNAEAACRLDADVETELEFEGSHAEVAASWLFVCENPDDLSQLDLTNLFSEFPGLEDIDAQWASDDSQSAAELTPSSPILRFE